MIWTRLLEYVLYNSAAVLLSCNVDLFLVNIRKVDAINRGSFYNLVDALYRLMISA